MFNEAREEAKRKCGIPEENRTIIDLKGHGPHCIKPEHWNELTDTYWNNEKWLKKSENGKKNRCSTKSGSISKHTGGSIPFALHAKMMVCKTKLYRSSWLGRSQIFLLS